MQILALDLILTTEKSLVPGKYLKVWEKGYHSESFSFLAKNLSPSRLSIFLEITTQCILYSVNRSPSDASIALPKHFLSK